MKNNNLKIKWSDVKGKTGYSCGFDVYIRHYSTLSKGQLQKQNPGLYAKIKREGNKPQT